MAAAPRIVDSGLLRKRADLYAPKPGLDEMGQAIERPEIVMHALPCSVNAIGGDEENRGNQLVAGATHLLETRFLVEIETTPDMFFVVQHWPPILTGVERRLNILRTVDPDGLRRRLFHYCKEQPLTNAR